MYIKNDGEMVDHETGTASMARNTNLNEDLGKVDYVFSDKTGTLTANEMQLREVAIKGVAYGNSSFRSIPFQSAASSSRLLLTRHHTLQGRHIRRFRNSVPNSPIADSGFTKEHDITGYQQHLAGFRLKVSIRLSRKACSAQAGGKD